jgi:hypothetical protein
MQETLVQRVDHGGVYQVPIAMHGCETFFRVREEYEFGAFVNSVLRIICRRKRWEVTGSCRMRSFIIFTLLQILSGRSNRGG